MPAFPLSDEQLLFLLTGLVYGLECIKALKRTACCFTPGWRRYHLVEPSTFLASGDRGMIFEGFLPYQLSFECPFQSWLLNEEGVVLLEEVIRDSTHSSSTVFPRFIRVEELTGLTRSGTQLICGEDVRIDCMTPRSAQILFDRLSQIQEAAPEERGQIVKDQTRAAFDIIALDERYRQFLRQIFPLRLACTVWAAWTLAAIVFLHFWPKHGYSEIMLLIATPGFLLLWLLTAGTLFRTNRTLRVLQGREWNHALCQLLLVPIAAMRSPNWFSRDILSDFDPLVIAAYFCRADAFLRLAQQRLLSLQFPLLEDRPSAEHQRATQIFRDSQVQMIAIVEELITSQGISLNELLQPPRRDPDAESYCPRCRGQYVIGVKRCPHCVGTRLQPFDSDRPNN